MKRLMQVLIALALVAIMATPAFAQGPRNGDHVCLGGSTTVNATDPVNSVVLFGCGARIQSGARVQRDLVSFGGDVTIEKDVLITGDVVVFGGNVDIAGQVGHRVTVFGGNLVLESTAVVQNDVNISGGLIDQKAGSIVEGRIVNGQPFSSGRVGIVPPAVLPAAVGGGVLSAITGLVFGLIRNVVYALALAALGALTVVFMPTQTHQVSDTAQKFGMESVGVGCLTTIVAFTLGIFLIFTICGIPFGILVLLSLVVAWMFGWIALGRLAGERILAAIKVHEILPIVAVVVGVLVLTIISYVPVIGWLVGFFLGLLGIGAVVLTRFGTRPYPMLTPAPVALTPTLSVAPSVPTTPSAPPAPSDPTPPSI
jgi:hypothetical protein